MRPVLFLAVAATIVLSVCGSRISLQQSPESKGFSLFKRQGCSTGYFSCASVDEGQGCCPIGNICNNASLCVGAETNCTGLGDEECGGVCCVDPLVCSEVLGNCITKTGGKYTPYTTVEKKLTIVEAPPPKSGAAGLSLTFLVLVLQGFVAVYLLIG
jgi:hypothetical protein